MAMVCLCHGITERKVARAIDKGASTVGEVADACGAGSCCYGCHDTIDDLIAQRVTVARSVGTAFA